MKKFQTLEEFLHSDEFSRKDLSYCDLSNLDLSSFPPSTWEGFTFYETNFTNTNIKFYPQTLKKNDIYDIFWILDSCNFTNCDLSYLKAEDLENFAIYKCNFTNTNFPVNSLDSVLVLCGVIFGDAYYGNVLDKYASKMDIDTLLLNPNLSFSSISSNSILKMLDNSSRFSDTATIGLDKVLDIDKKQEGKLWKFWNIISTNVKFSNNEKIKVFYERLICKKNFTTLDLSGFGDDFLDNFTFLDCSFEKIIFPNSDMKMININNSKVEKVIFPNITPSSWNKINRKRLFSNITFYRNLYVELGRFCNGKCQFCRNQYLEPCEYDFETIFENLHKLYPYLDNIVIGGGEPTLLTEDLKKLCYSDVSNKITIFTNASLHYDELMELNAMAPLNISRHSMDDDENNKILGVEALTNLNLRFLCAFHHLKPITLCATCFKNGLDSKDKILDYIKYYSKEVKIHNFLFQTLHQDLNAPFSSNTVLPISNHIFDLVIHKLRKKGYEISISIYSTGDYKLIIAKKDGIKISFKQYITKEELESKWYQSPKRTFDLSMDPSGNLYENWHQSSGKVLIKELH